MERTMEEYSLHDYLNKDVKYTNVSVKVKVFNCETEEERTENIDVRVPYEMYDCFGERFVEIDRECMYEEVCDELALSDDEECEIESYYYC